MNPFQEWKEKNKERGEWRSLLDFVLQTPFLSELNERNVLFSPFNLSSSEEKRQENRSRLLLSSTRERTSYLESKMTECVSGFCVCVFQGIKSCGKSKKRLSKDETTRGRWGKKVSNKERGMICFWERKDSLNRNCFWQNQSLIKNNQNNQTAIIDTYHKKFITDIEKKKK